MLIQAQSPLKTTPKKRTGVTTATRLIPLARTAVNSWSALKRPKTRSVAVSIPIGVLAGLNLREVADGIRERHPRADWISAGMSGDLEAAVALGATHLRVGSAILGSREPRG